MKKFAILLAIIALLAMFINVFAAEGRTWNGKCSGGDLQSSDSGCEVCLAVVQGWICAGICDENEYVLDCEYQGGLEICDCTN